MTDTEKQLAVMKNVGYGCRDFNDRVGLWFDAYTSEYTAALQCLFDKEAEKFIKAYGVYDVHKLEGKPVWVSVDGAYIRIVGPAIL